MKALFGLGFVSILLVAAPVAAQSGATPDPVAAELVKLNRSVEGLVELMRSALGRQRQEILLRRLEIARAELAPLTAERRRVRESSESIERKRSQLLAQRDFTLEGARNDEERAALRQRFETIELELDQELEALRGRLGTLDAEAVPIEQKIERFEGLLDDALDLE